MKTENEKEMSALWERFGAEAVYASITGEIRENNEDNYCFAQTYREIGEKDSDSKSSTKKEVQGQWSGVFDGIGGLPRGEEASYLAARKLAQREKDEMALRKEKQEETENIQDVFADLNGEIIRWSKEHKIRQMGTTMAAIKITDTCVYGINSGDSRIYRFREGHLQQLSKDQVYRYPGHLYSSLIGYLGNETNPVKPEILQWERQAGDRYLICTDGVTNMVPDTELHRVLGLPLEKAISELMKEVVRYGAQDNATAILADIY